MKKHISKALAAFLFLSSIPLTGCTTTNSENVFNENVLRIASWDEYIDEGGEDSYVPDSNPLYEEFEDWYFEQTGKEIKVVYIGLQDNETMYNKIKMGNYYDLLCPSEYMIMKLAAENKLQKFPTEFYDTNIPTNYYAKHISPYIKEVFDNGKTTDGSSWSEYAAGYMWGTTGFIYNPEKIPSGAMKSWNVLSDRNYHRKITAKDNVRDSYFMGLGMYYEKELLQEKEDYENGIISRETYQNTLNTLMNDTSVETMNGVKKKLENMRENLYGLETDEGKLDVIMGRLDASFQWSGDAVYILDEAEAYSDEDSPLLLEYSIPESASNLWFDGWVMMKGANVDAATAFINFVSMPQNVIRNMYYIGYTSCIASEEVFEYIQETYSVDETCENAVPYDLSYFFGANHSFLTDESQTRRQLFAQYPDSKTIDRLVVMNYFDKKTNERANRMWNNIK